MSTTIETDGSPICFRRFRDQWNWFFFESPDPRMCAVIRIGYAALLLLMLLIQMPDAVLWFSDAGVLPFEISRQVVDTDTATIFQWISDDPATVSWCYRIFLLQTILLLVGFRSQFQAISLLVWLASFHHRNCMLVDGEDTVFRLFAFLLALSPCGICWSVDAWLKPAPERLKKQSGCAWALRLMQIQLTIIYVSTAWEKLNGASWLDGTALYYASRLDDMFGRFPVPEFLFGDPGWLKLMTWSVLAVEVALPICLWIRQTRKAAIVVGILLHLSIEWMMNLFLFEWVMIVGLMAFAVPNDFARLIDSAGHRLKRINLPRTKGPAGVPSSMPKVKPAHDETVEEIAAP